MTNCEHNKVYSNHMFCTFPPQKAWICRKCGLEGVELINPVPSTFADEYTAIKKKFQDKS